MGVLQRLRDAAKRGLEVTQEELRRIVDYVLLTRKRAFRATFNRENRAALIVLQVLAEKSKLFETTFHRDPDVQKHLEGRRWLMLFILDHIDMDKDEFLAKYRRKDIE